MGALPSVQRKSKSGEQNCSRLRSKAERSDRQNAKDPNLKRQTGA